MGQQLADDDVVFTLEHVRDGAREPLIVLQPLLAFLDLCGIGAGDDVQMAPIGEGHSNVTLMIRRGGRTVVLRRPPRGPYPPSAHDVLREARVLSALAGHARVPEVLAVCADPAIIGAPFYVMELVPGTAVTDTIPGAIDTPAHRRRISEELVDALVEMHSVDWKGAGLASLGKSTGYLDRQLRRFLGLWEHHKTREIPAVESVAAWLSANMPTSVDATIVHGDYRLGNVLITPDPPVRVTAILDWEMSTIGDPLADVGYLAAMWVDPDDPVLDFQVGSVTRGDGFLRREELIARYAERSGRSARDIRWYQTLALWKAIIFMEGNYKRAAAGSVDDPFLQSFQEGVLQLAEHAQRTAAAR